MCGIAGFFKPGGGESDREETLKRMTDAIHYRGPDSEGHWLDLEAGIALGHRRLAIVDLSPQGYQPMTSASGRFVIIFNGEIYNFQDIHQELLALNPNLTFRGTSDTEVLLAAVEQWGVEAAVKKFVGMFAFALWDRESRTLYLARDRMGEKPLYYGWSGKIFLFGSELIALAEFPGWRGEINRDALSLFMRHNYIPGQYSIYEGIYKLPPATILTLKESHPGDLPAPVPYWSMKQAAEYGNQHPFTGTEEEAITHLENLLKKAIHDQMIADVPLGAFLSGGIDSSTIVALMQMQSSQPIKTFSIGFHEEEYNEAPYAKAVAEYLGTDHTEVYLNAQDALAVIPKLPSLYSEPFADPSQIPTYLVAGVARQHVTVSLSGDAGDELFAGYDRYFRAERAYRKVNRFPMWFQSGVHYLFKPVVPPIWQSLINMEHRMAKQNGNRIHKLRKWIQYLPVKNLESLYYLQFSHTDSPNELVPGSHSLPTAFTDESTWAKLDDIYQHMTFLDAISYLPDDILVKVDRASMGVSLESRVPLLNHHVVEFSQQVPVSMKVRNGQGKWLLRQLLYRHVPRELVERPKKGFGVPIDSWLRRDLRDWGEALLDESRLRNEGFLNARMVRQVWNEHLEGIADHHYFLWNILMFQAWQEKWLQKPVSRQTQ